MAWGINAGYAINPARDLGPRLAVPGTGYGTAMEDQNGSLYFWVPIVGPLLGGLIGGGHLQAADRGLPARGGCRRGDPAGRPSPSEGRQPTDRMIPDPRRLPTTM